MYQFRSRQVSWARPSGDTRLPPAAARGGLHEHAGGHIAARDDVQAVCLDCQTAPHPASPHASHSIDHVMLSFFFACVAGAAEKGGRQRSSQWCASACTFFGDLPRVLGSLGLAWNRASVPLKFGCSVFFGGACCHQGLPGAAFARPASAGRASTTLPGPPPFACFLPCFHRISQA